MIWLDQKSSMIAEPVTFLRGVAPEQRTRIFSGPPNASRHRKCGRHGLPGLLSTPAANFNLPIASTAWARRR